MCSFSGCRTRNGGKLSNSRLDVMSLPGSPWLLPSFFPFLVRHPEQHFFLQTGDDTRLTSWLHLLMPGIYGPVPGAVQMTHNLVESSCGLGGCHFLFMFWFSSSLGPGLGEIRVRQNRK